MIRRIAVWAGAGFLIAGCWELFAFATYPLTNERIHQMWLLFRITCPVVAASVRFPMSWYFALLVNAATYAMVGLACEMVRRPGHKLSTTH
jgi:hypothetical protein